MIYKIQVHGLNSDSLITSWNRLAKIQYEQTQCSYFLTATEDTVLVTKGTSMSSLFSYSPDWSNVVVKDFLNNPWKENFGVIEARVISSKIAETPVVVPVVHASHFEIFGYLTPSSLNRLEASRWLKDVYRSFSAPSSNRDTT